MLERPLVYLVPPAAAALYSAVCLGAAPDWRLSLLLLAVFLFLSGLFVQRKRLFALCGMMAAASLAFSGFAVYNHLVVAPIRALADRSMEIQATLLEDPDHYEDSQRALLSVTQANGIEQTFRVQCYLPLTETPLYAGDHIEVSVRFYCPSVSDGFDRAEYQAANRCFLAATYREDEDGAPVRFAVTGSSRDGLRFLPQRIARAAKATIADKLAPRPAGLLTALLLGDKSGISDADDLSLRIAGLSHLVAVSGLHIGFLVAFCSLLGHRTGTLVSVPFILLFVPIAGATPSVIRAAIMYLITAGAFLLKKEANSLNSLFAALALLLLLNPYSIASLSLQLSFTATLGLILLAEPMQRRMMRPFYAFPKPIRQLGALVVGSLSCTVCATIFTTPILLSAFGYVSILSIVSNLLVVGVTAVCFVGGFVMCLTAPLLPSVSSLCAAVISPLLTYILNLCGRIAAIPFGRINWSDGFGVAALTLFAAAVLLWLLVGSRIKWRIALPALCVALCGITAVGAYDNWQNYTLTYLPCGSGQAIILSDAAGSMTLIDCAGEGGARNAAEKVRAWMQWNGFGQIDTLVLTAVDRGHARDLPALLEHTQIERILIPSGCRETQYNRELLALVRQRGAEEVAAPLSLSAAAPIELLPVCEGKLAARIADHTLVLHSPTQKQLASLLQTTALRAPNVVISQRNMEDMELFRQMLAQTGAQHIILQSATGDTLRHFEGVPIDSPYLSGEMRERYRKEG